MTRYVRPAYDKYLRHPRAVVELLAVVRAASHLFIQLDDGRAP